jgi:xanthine dehydrogenase small subunit
MVCFLAAAQGDELRDDAHRDLFGGDRTDVQADRREQALEGQIALAFVTDTLDEAKDLAATADEADVARLVVGGRLQRALVQLMIVRDDDDPIALIELVATKRVAWIVEQKLTTGKSLGRVELIALVHHPHVESHRQCQGRGRTRYMARTEQPQPRCRKDRFHEDVHSASAAHAEVVRQVTGQKLAFAALEDSLQHLSHQVFDSAPAHGSQRASILPEQQARARLLGRRARNPYHRCNGPTLTARQQSGDGFKDVAHAFHQVPTRGSREGFVDGARSKAEEDMVALNAMAIRFVLNGSPVEVPSLGVPPHTTLLQWLRANGFSGTKEGCAEGECGACAVALLTSGPGESGSHFEAVNSCLLPFHAVAGREIVSVEGVADSDGELHPVQRAMVEVGGSQCGYCTPGFVVSLFCEYYRPGRADFEPESISGNLCRCTGYRPIADVARGLASPMQTDARLVRLRRRAPDLTAPADAESAFFRPTSLPETWDLLDAHPTATPIAGGTDLIVYANQRYQRFPKLISLEALADFSELTHTADEIVIGASVSLSRLERWLGEQALGATMLEQLLPLFSSRLIRNRATLGGNLGTASPIGDLAPALLALGARIELASRRGARSLPLAQFFTGYRTTALAPGELIRAVRVPRPLPTFQRFYKVSKRVLDDISTVACGLSLSLDAAGKIERFGAGFGGVAATPIASVALEQAARGRRWNEETLLVAEASLLGTPQDDFRGSAAYRRALLGKLLEKFFYETQTAAQAAE